MKHIGMNLRTIATVIFAILLFAGCQESSDDDGANVTGTTDPSTPPPTATNHAPVISGTPATSTVVGETWSFQPNASDPEGDALTFTVQNKPQWAIFETDTGELSGNVQTGDEGTYNNIRISVSDGEFTTNLPQFNIEVSAAALGSVTLTWTAPTENEDGSPLTDLAGYNFYYGTQSGNYPNQISLDNPGVTTYVVENLAPNTYFFVATAVNNDGVESRYTNEASKQVL